MRLFDAHCHLQDEPVNRLAEIVTRAEKAGVAGLMCCGIQESDWETVRGLCNRYRALFPSFGLHPWFVSGRTPRWFEKLEGMIRETRAGVGEIGLDYLVRDADREDQAEVFVRQLRLASAYHRPVSIHCRKAWGTLMEILKKEGGLPRGGVIHSFSGSKEMVRELEKMGAYISFSGSVTRLANKKAEEAVKAVSAERLLVETDAPYIMPSGMEGDCNEPANITRVLSRVAEIRGEKEEELAETTFHNAMVLFAN